MKGICLCGGAGTRLFPITKGVSKQLLPVYDKPMVYYPLSTLMLAGIHDILIISTPEDIGSFERLLGNGSQFGINLSYAVQEKPEGIAQAFIIGEEFFDGDDCCLVLGDNIFYGSGFSGLLRNVTGNGRLSDAVVFGYRVDDPWRYGVAVFDDNGKCIEIEEKPANPKSNYAVTGLYFYPGDVVEKVKNLKPSARGELEITDLNQQYIKEKRMNYVSLPRGFAWLDTGTFSSLSQASNFIESIETRTGRQIACLEEIALNNGWISLDDVKHISIRYKNNDYGQYLSDIAKEIEKKYIQ